MVTPTCPKENYHITGKKLKEEENNRLKTKSNQKLSNKMIINTYLTIITLNNSMA